MRGLAGVGLRAGGGDARSGGLLNIFFALGYAAEVVTDADNFGDAAEESGEGLDDGGRKLDGPLLACDVRRVGVAHEPVDVGVKPNVQAMRLDDGYHVFRNAGGKKFLVHDGLEVGLDQHAAVERG